MYCIYIYNLHGLPFQIYTHTLLADQEEIRQIDTSQNHSQIDRQIDRQINIASTPLGQQALAHMYAHICIYMAYHVIQHSSQAFHTLPPRFSSILRPRFFFSFIKNLVYPIYRLCIRCSRIETDDRSPSVYRLMHSLLKIRDIPSQQSMVCHVE